MRLALAQINPTIGDLAGNSALIINAANAAADAGADLVALPELCLTGYPPKDLLYYPSFIAAAERAAGGLISSLPRDVTVIFGTPRKVDGGIANSLMACHDGQNVVTYDKRLLPTYDVFDENRYFIPGAGPAALDLPIRYGKSIRVGLAICEDLWKGHDAGFASRYAGQPDPVDDLAGLGARLLIVPSASPFVLRKHQRHLNILKAHATRHFFHVASINQVGGNDDLIFDGRSCVVSPDGSVLAEAAPFADDLLVVNLPNPEVPGLGSSTAPLVRPNGSLAHEQQLFLALTLGIRDYCRKTGFTTAVLGLSGGIDSALTAALAAAALGPANLTGVLMPGAYSSDHSVADAMDLAERCGIKTTTVPITPPIDGFRTALDPAFASRGLPRLGEKLPDLAEENLQSRIRGTLLMALSNRTGSILLTTGNKSELAVGYCTLYGDMNGGLAVLSDVTKELVYALSRWINANHAVCGFARPPIPQRSIEKPPSAELRPGQTDQDSLPPYPVLDEIIERYVEQRQSLDKIVKETGFDAALVSRIALMIDLSEYKRKQTAVGLKVTTVAFGSGRRMPIAQRWRG